MTIIQYTSPPKKFWLIILVCYPDNQIINYKRDILIWNKRLIKTKKEKKKKKEKNIPRDKWRKRKGKSNNGPKERQQYKLPRRVSSKWFPPNWSHYSMTLLCLHEVSLSSIWIDSRISHSRPFSQKLHTLHI